MLIEDYFAYIEGVIADVPTVLIMELVKDKRSPYIGFIEGKLYFRDGSLLQFVEFVNVKTVVERYKYSYHYQDEAGQLLFRYDMAPHHPGVVTFPHHKHLASGMAIDSTSPPLEEVLNEIENLLGCPA